MTYIIPAILTVVLLLVVLKGRLFANLKYTPKIFAGLFLLKLSFGIIFLYIYSKHYTDKENSDIYKYYDDAVKIYDLTGEDVKTYWSILSGLNSSDKSAREVTQQLNYWYQDQSSSVINDSRSVIRFNLLLLPISGGNIYIHLVIMVFLSFIGLVLLYIALEKYFYNKELWLLLACFGIASVMFWSSGIIKEGLVMFYLGLFFYAISKLKSKNLVFCLFLLVLSFLGIFFAKFYIALSLIPSILFWGYTYLLPNKNSLIVLGYTVLTIALSGFVLNMFLNNVPLEKLAKKQNDFINRSVGGVYLKNTNSPFDTIYTLSPQSLSDSNASEKQIVQLKDGTIYHHWVNPFYTDTLIASNNNNRYEILAIFKPTGSAVPLKHLSANYTSVIQLLPQALINAFFRPFIFDINNALSLLACVENVLLVLLIVFAFMFFQSPNNEQLRLIIFSLLFVFTLYALVGITTPVLGAIVRYKMPGLPLLVASLALFIDKAKLYNIFCKKLT